MANSHSELFRVRNHTTPAVPEVLVHVVCNETTLAVPEALVRMRNHTTPVGHKTLVRGVDMIQRMAKPV